MQTRFIKSNRNAHSFFYRRIVDPKSETGETDP